MKSMLRRLALLMPLLLAAEARAQDACDEVECSGHGECMLEDDDPFCLCEDGYAATDLRCVPVEDPGRSEAARRSSSIGARIVQIATAQGGRSAGMVGRDRPDDPGPLRRFLKPGEMWCSDFVAWVYRAAGVPFTGGYHGGWHLTNNYAMRTWFSRQDRWVARDSESYRRFQPRPGDYLRFDTRSGNGHSAIVRYVAGSTLYTIEGNARGGVVRLRRYWHYKRNRRIDGFGIVTNAEARSQLLVGPH